MRRALLCCALLFSAWPAEPGAAETAVVTTKAPTIPETSKAASEVARAISDCADNMTCPLLSNFKANYGSAFEWLKVWCKARVPVTGRMESETRVCDAATKGTDDEMNQVSVFDLVEIAPVIAKPNCSGFGLVVPLYSVRHVGTETVVNGPVKAGLGGGYYWGLVCKRSFSFGPEAFGYSEGLDPSGLFHLGVGGGVQLAAFTYFQFGLAMGYDLYRRDASTTPNGLLSAKGLGKASVSWLITFSIVPQESEK